MRGRRYTNKLTIMDKLKNSSNESTHQQYSHGHKYLMSDTLQCELYLKPLAITYHAPKII